MLDTNYSSTDPHRGTESTDAYTIEVGGYPLSMDTGEPVGGNK